MSKCPVCGSKKHCIIAFREIGYFSNGAYTAPFLSNPRCCLKCGVIYFSEKTVNEMANKINSEMERRKGSNENY